MSADRRRGLSYVAEHGARRAGELAAARCGAARRRCACRAPGLGGAGEHCPVSAGSDVPWPADGGRRDVPARDRGRRGAADLVSSRRAERGGAARLRAGRVDARHSAAAHAERAAAVGAERPAVASSGDRRVARGAGGDRGAPALRGHAVVGGAGPPAAVLGARVGVAAAGGPARAVRQQPRQRVSHAAQRAARASTGTRRWTSCAWASAATSRA